jgi:hypothetical protein
MPRLTKSRKGVDRRAARLSHAGEQELASFAFLALSTG